MGEGVRSEARGSVGWVIFDRAEQRNALDLTARAAFGAAVSAFDADPAVRVLVLTGAGTAFCSGTDLSAPPDPDHPLLRNPERLVAPLDRLRKPIIAAVNGPAAGGGLEIALACDLRIAARSAKFLLPELRIGSLPGSGGTQRIFRALPSAVAAHILYTGTPINADDALRHGLVNDVVDDEALVAAAEALAARVAEAAPLSLIATKLAARAALESTAGYDLERRLWDEISRTEDRAEGRAAFRERRAPRFTGR